MEIKVKITKGNWGTCKAIATITLDGVFVVSGLKIMEGKNGLFVSMPSRKDAKGEYKDTCFPITKEFREQINTAVLAEYGGMNADVQKEIEEDDLNSLFPF